MAEQIEIDVIHSNRKTISLEITPDAKVKMRVPYRTSDREIRRFLEEKSGWITRHLYAARKRLADRPEIKPFTEQEKERLYDLAGKDLKERVRRWSAVVGVDYGRITIRMQKTRWGSCSAKGNLNFNALLMLAPERVRDYVVIHELCHRKEMNHSSRFWREVARVMPDYHRQIFWLREHGDELMRYRGE